MSGEGRSNLASVVRAAVAGVVLAAAGELVMNNLVFKRSLGNAATSPFVLATLLAGGAALAFAVLRPRLGIVAALAYSASPLSFYILFSHTSIANPYPDSADLALDATLSFMPLAAAALGLLLSRGLRSSARLVQSSLGGSMALLGGVALLGAAYGLAVGNAPRLVATDLLPVAELLICYYVAFAFAKDRSLAWMVILVLGTLTVTTVVRLILAHSGVASFGVNRILLGSQFYPRLYLLQPLAWALPFTIALAVIGKRREFRALAFAASVIFSIAITISFERGLWAFAAIGVASVGGYFTIRLIQRALHPRNLVWLPLAAVIVLSSVGILIGANPIQLVAARVLATQDQLSSTSPISHKRQDEASCILGCTPTPVASPARTANQGNGTPKVGSPSSSSTSRRLPAWLFGKGLGATYIGPTGTQEGNYAALQYSVKHYTFDTYLAVWLREGFVGLAALCLLLFSIGSLGVRLIRSRGGMETKALGFAMLGALIGLAATSTLDPYLLAHPITMWEGATYGILAGFVNRRVRDWPSSSALNISGAPNVKAD
jgi:hypothetical protein